MELKEDIERIEGVSSQTPDFLSDAYKDPNNLETWRKILFSYKKQESRLVEIIEARDLVVSKYDLSIDKRKLELERLKAFMINQIEASKFNTKSGGKKVDHFPDIGVFSVSKKSPKFDVCDDSYFINKGFSRVIPEETKVDKNALNEYLKSCEITPAGIISDPKTGEVIENIMVKFESKVTFKGVES